MTHVLRHRDFRLLWLGHSISSVGDRLIVVALVLYVVELTGRASDVGVVLAAHILPMVVFVLLGGVWADRLPRRSVMIVSDLVRFGLHGAIAVLVLLGAMEIWILVVLVALGGCATAFHRPAFHGLLPQTVPEAELQPANALAGITGNLAEFAGPALATALVLGVGAGWAFALDAASFVVSAAFLLGVRPRPRGEPAATASFAADLREGYEAVRERAWVWATLVAFCGTLLVAYGPWTVLGPLVAPRALRRDRDLRGLRDGDRRRDRPRRAGRRPLAAAVPDARGDAARPDLARLGRGVRRGRAARADAGGDVRGGRRALAVRGLVAHGPRRADPSPPALARDVVRLHGIAAAAARRLPARRPASDAFGAAEVLLGGSVLGFRDARARAPAARDADARAARRADGRGRGGSGGAAGAGAVNGNGRTASGEGGRGDPEEPAQRDTRRFSPGRCHVMPV
jgi:hypothetical protein